MKPAMFRVGLCDPGPGRAAALSMVVAAAALLLGAIVPARAQSPDIAALRLRTLAASCAHCHGTDGRAAEGSTVPGLAGRPADEIASSMAAFKAGSRPSTVMGQIALGYSDEQIRQLSMYFAALPAPPRK
jgi:cytochrome c553